MRYLSIFILSIATSFLFGQRPKIHLIPNQLIDKKIHWAHLEEKDSEEKKRTITEELIDQKKIFLCHSGNIKGEKNMEKFMQIHSTSFHLVDLNVDGTPELIFNGYDCDDTDNEFLYIYGKTGDHYEILYSKKGNIIGYKKNPHTRETLLIHFNYPCCRNGSNNLNTLRFVNGKIIEFRKEYFAARTNFMKGPFLPDSIDRKGPIKSAKKLIELRWSPAVIDTMAWEGTVQKNIIIAYPKGAKFRVLAEKKDKEGNIWYFVISRTPPILNKRYIVEPANFIDTKVYGWVRKESLM